MLEPSYLLDVSEEFSSLVRFAYNPNNNYYNNKILKSDWLSTALISALIGQYASCLSNWTIRAITRALKWPFFTASKKKSWNFLCFDLKN